MAEKTDAASLYFKTIHEITQQIPREEMFTLWKKAKKGDRNAKQRILELNLRLVVPISRRYHRPGMDLMDLIEEGNLGLLQAIDKFEPKKGYRFSTYATYWIEQFIRKAAEEQSGTIKIPSHAWDGLRKWIKQWDKLQGKFGRNPTLSEMAHKMNLSARQIKTVIEAYELMKGMGSLGSPAGVAGSDITLADTLIDTRGVSPDNLFSELSVKNGFREALNLLDKREKEILLLRHGIYGKKPLTLREVGKKLKISRERVRQLENRAITNLKKTALRMGIIEPEEKVLRPSKIKTDILGKPIKKRRSKK